jgi:hypothetical protein
MNKAKDSRTNSDADGHEQGSQRTSTSELVVIAMLCLGTVLVLADVVANTARAGFEFYTTFQTPEAFLEETFNSSVPAPETLAVDAGVQASIRPIFGRAFPQPRLRYWRMGDSTVWIFDDIGKEGYVPTTAGFVVKDGAIDRARVLIYRESRGEQVGEPYFLRQLIGARASGSGLDRPVDNITGATYSVKMMERMARTAIQFDSLVQ